MKKLTKDEWEALVLLAGKGVLKDEAEDLVDPGPGVSERIIDERKKRDDPPREGPDIHLRGGQ